MSGQKKYIALAAIAIIIADLLFLKYKFAYSGLFLACAILLASLPLIYELIQSALKMHFGVDLIAIVAIVFSLFVGQYLAGAVILLMLSGGESLEQYALKRARKELTNLISNAPSVAHKKTDGSTVDIDVDKVVVGDLLLVKPNEVVPVDALVKEGESMIDQSAITGESEPVEILPGSHIYSGSVNKEHPVVVEATNTSSASKYQRIIALVREAEQNKAPIVRLADRYTLFFTLVTFALALVAWFVSKDPQRLLAVLVVATPCPLILATPIAIISGISKVSNAGVIAKNGGALEKLGEVKAFIFDKTGTLTIGTPRVAEVRLSGYAAAGGAGGDKGSYKERALQIASSLDQYSAHIFADALTDYARKNKIKPMAISGFKEETGKGVNAELNGKKYYLGKLSYLREKGVSVSAETEQQHAKNQEKGLTEIFLADTKQEIAGITFMDEIRPETKNVFKRIRRLGVSKLVIATGDKPAIARKIGDEIDVKEVLAELLPEQKVDKVKEMQKYYAPVAVVGDGVNDAPALATSDVGIAMGARGSSASSEAADLVVMTDNLDKVADALEISKRMMRVAKQGIFFGMGASIALMFIAAGGHIHPVAGAMMQEALDVAVIFNALRVNIK